MRTQFDSETKHQICRGRLAVNHLTFTEEIAGSNPVHDSMYRISLTVEQEPPKLLEWVRFLHPVPNLGEYEEMQM